MQTSFQGDHNCLHLIEIVQLGHKWLSRLVGLVLLLHRLLDDVVGSVDDVGLGLAVVLLLAVAETQSTLAAQLQYVGIIVIEVVKKSKVKISRWRSQPPLAGLAPEKPAGTWDWPEDEHVYDENEHLKWWIYDAELKELRERTHPSHLHTLALT